MTYNTRVILGSYKHDVDFYFFMLLFPVLIHSKFIRRESQKCEPHRYAGSLRLCPLQEPKGPTLAEGKLKKENEKLNEKIEAFKKASKVCVIF